MNMRWMRLVLGFILSLSLTACNKRSSSSSNPEVAPPPVPAPVLPPQTTPTRGAIQTPPHIPGRSVRAEDPDRHQPKKDGSGSSGEQTPGGSSNPGGGPIITITPGTGGGPNGRPPGPPVEESELKKLQNEAERYSGTANDGLRDYLIYKQAQVGSEAQKIKDMKFAQSIESANYRYDRGLRKFRFELRMRDEKGNLQVINLVGHLKESVDSLASNWNGLTANASCFDATMDAAVDAVGPQEPSCQTVVVNLNYKNADAQVIFRKSGVASIFGRFPNRNCLTAACHEVYSLFSYDNHEIKEPNTLRFSSLETFEVIQGRSGFKFFLLTHTGELVKVAGPLASPAYPKIETVTNRTLTADELKDPRTGQIYKTNMNQSLNDVRVVKNDGKGNLTLQVRMPLQSNGDRDVFDLEVKRGIREIRVPLNTVP